MNVLASWPARAPLYRARPLIQIKDKAQIDGLQLLDRGERLHYRIAGLSIRLLPGRRPDQLPRGLPDLAQRSPDRSPGSADLPLEIPPRSPHA
jgi:hypothetical protein